MMEIWIEDEHGTRLGEGPLLSAQNWFLTDRLNGAGEFSFQVPVADPRAALVQFRRWVRCWQWQALGGWREVGYGRITSIQTTYAGALPMLLVAGVNELGALADRLCPNLALATRVQRHPAVVWQNDRGSPVILTDVIDNEVRDTSTSNVFKFYYGGWLSVAHDRIFDQIDFEISSGNSLPYSANFTARYWDSELGGYQPLDITDTTVSSGKSLMHSGSIRFTPPETWGQAGGGVFFIVLDISDQTDWITCSDITVWTVEMAADPLGAVMGHAPPGWGLDGANGYLTVQGRPMGAELLTNGSFEALDSGAPDNETTDVFTGWTNALAHASAKVLQVGSGHDGRYAAKLSSGIGRGSIAQTVSVTAGMDYTLEFWQRSDGNGRLAYRIAVGAATAWDYGSYYARNDITGVVDCGLVTEWTHVRRTVTVPDGVMQLTVIFYSPAASGATAWVDGVTLRAGGGDPIYLQLRDESVLEGLRRIADTNNERFIRSPAGRQVLWLGRDQRDSGLRAIGPAISAGRVSAPDTLLIENLIELVDVAQVVSRIYPYGGGMGGSRVTLADATYQAPPGYTINKNWNYLERDAAVAALGIVECTQSWSDIVPHDRTITQRRYAANALLLQAWQYLELHSATDTDRVYGDVPRFYRARVTKSERDVLPGYTLRVQYHQWRRGVHVVDIDRRMWVTGVTHEVTQAGVYVVGLELATVPRWVDSDATLIARNLIRLRDVIAHNTASGY